MFRYHVVGCRQLSSQELLEEGYVTTLSGHPLRIHEREVGLSPGRPAPALDHPREPGLSSFQALPLCSWAPSLRL